MRNAFIKEYRFCCKIILIAEKVDHVLRRLRERERANSARGIRHRLVFAPRNESGCEIRLISMHGNQFPYHSETCSKSSLTLLASGLGLVNSSKDDLRFGKVEWIGNRI